MKRLPPLTITGSEPEKAVTFAVATFLAPMDGVTDRTYRDLVLDLGDVGGACTEFVRVSVSVVPRKVFVRELGPPREDIPVGVQIMAPSPDYLAESVRNAEAVGAPWIDLNFGCPVKRVFNKCAGSALLAFPDRVEAIVAAAAGATGIPVTAKLRAGVDDATLLDEIVDACAEGGAAAVALHARLRTDSYADPSNWEWIAGAAARLAGRIPLIGNGSVSTADDIHRMLAETGCDGVMVGRGAFADPWVFREARGGAPATHEEALAFAHRYLDILCPRGGRRGGLGRFKQMARIYRAGGFLAGNDDVRQAILRSNDPDEVRELLSLSMPSPGVAEGSADRRDSRLGDACAFGRR